MSSDDDFILSKKKKISRNDFESSGDDDVPLSKYKKIKKETPKKSSSLKKVSSKSSSKKIKSKSSKPLKKKTTGKLSSSKKLVKGSPKKSKSVSVRKMKVQNKTERLDMAIKAYRWWRQEELPEGIQWRSLEHNGVLFPLKYECHKVPLVYDGNRVELTAEQEELASFYASMPLDGPQLGNAVTKKIFDNNFFTDFKQLLGNDHLIRNFSKCDFSLIREHLDNEREKKKAMTKEEKQPEKDKKSDELFKHGVAMLDGHLEKVGNFRIEPPGLFRGRGEHPKTGTFKKRVQPEEVTINVGMGDKVPPCPIPGRSWKEVIHRDTVTWLAYWNENVMGGIKYVWLAASSSFKGKSDLEKYEKARNLKNCIGKIRKDYIAGLKSTDMLIKQRSTAMWVIDILALRVGNEKGEDEADTVGCCSLRVEHMNFNDETYELTLSFLGKDSMPYNNTVRLDQYENVGKQVFKNLKSFCHKKKKNEEVFNELTPQDVNKHLGSLMPGLSAKVFRTYNASFTLEGELPHNLGTSGEPAQKVIKYNDANRKVAILCNHQRTVPKTFESTLVKMNDQLSLLESQKKELAAMVLKVQKGKKVALRSESEDPEIKKKESHLSAKQPTVDQVKKKLASWDKKIQALELKLQDKTDNKEVALGTSKINYMDPRITVAWCKRNEVPISSVFAKTLREKFVWAMDVPPDWQF